MRITKGVSSWPTNLWLTFAVRCQPTGCHLPAKRNKSYYYVGSTTFTQNIQGDSLARGPKILSIYTQSNSAGFSFVNTGKQFRLKHAQTAFRTEFGERRAPSKCCIQKLVKELETRGSRSNACRLLSLGPIEGQSVQKYTPHNRKTQRRYTPRDSSRQRRHFGKSIPEFGEAHSSVLGRKRKSVSASIMSRSCFVPFRYVYINFQVII